MTFLDELKNLTVCIRDENKEVTQINAYTYYIDLCEKLSRRIETYRFEIIINILNTCYHIDGKRPVRYLFDKYVGDAISKEQLTEIPADVENVSAETQS